MTTAPRRVLVVEDDAAIRRGVVAALTFAGYDLLEAGDSLVVDLAHREIRHTDGDVARP